MMTIKEGLKKLHSVHREFSQTAYDFTSFHNDFRQRGFSKIDSTTSPAGHIETAVNNISDMLLNVYDNFSNYDIANAVIEPNTNLMHLIENSETYCFDLRNSLLKQNKHTSIWLSIIESKDIDFSEHDKLVELRSIMSKQTEHILNVLEHDPVFKAKLKMISSQLVSSRNEPASLEFLNKKFNLLKKDFPSGKNELIQILFKEYQNNYNYFINTSRRLIEDQNPDEFLSMADKFLLTDLSNENKLQQFLINLNNDIDVEMTIEFSKSQTIERLHIFKDNSIVVKNSYGDYTSVKNIQELSYLLHTAFQDGIDYTLRKNPTINKFFKNKFNEDRQYNSCISAMLSYKEHAGYLKSVNFDINSFKEKSFEAIDDAINALVQKHKIEKFAKSILSGKYMDLLNEKTFPYFETLYNEDFSTKDLQNYIGKKLAAIHTEEDFINMLKKTVSGMNGFDIDTIMDKLSLYKIEPILHEDGILTFEVDNYKKCTQFGPAAWCIVREEHYYTDYTENGEKQYIAYNFNKDINDIESVIGFTLTTNGSLKAAHFKNDDEIYTEEEDISNIIYKTLYLNQENHTLTDEKKETLKARFGNKEIAIKNNKLKAM